MSEFSKRIQEARHSKGFTIEDLAEKTKISHRFLRALEEDHYHLFPNRVVAKGFVKRLAKFLNVNEEELTRLFEEAFPETTSLGTTPQKPEEFIFKKEHLYLVVSGIILVLALLLVFNVYFSNPVVREVPSQTLQEAPQSTVVEALPASEPAMIHSDGVHLVLNADSDVWVQVMVDGTTAYEGMILSGASKSFDAQERVRVYAGNAPHLFVKINGKDFGPVDPTRTVSRILFIKGDEKPTILSLPPPKSVEASSEAVP